MSATPTRFAPEAVTYHGSLAEGWEHRYRKSSFQMRQAVLGNCLQGRNLAGTLWLDAGCGTGTLARWLAARGCSVLGVDAAPEMVVAANQSLRSDSHSDRLSFVHIKTISRLALDDRSLDGILCSSVLEYLPDPSACLTEFARVLKPRGLLLVSVPNRNSIARRLQLACHHVGSLLGQSWCKFLDYSRHQYSRPEFDHLLVQTGFNEEVVVPFGGPLPRLARRSCLWAPLLMFVAQKLA
ncbi:MAG TPA: class I SAM-dependent methyltransferase [Terriglobales bacterium]|nr:class I SAM-dependent methyltransferase [Terriglobales bacterium]